MADEIHPAQPLVPSTSVDTPADEKRRYRPKQQDKQKPEDHEDIPPNRPPKTGIIDEYV
ncbi:hypothetical protein [Methylophaga sp.]|uniref:hypothetical protein n=1 Tax=Methylophaga sp. TaxID=2024840 RepID=UPI0027195CCB|nr:hypothetical protein [Methylophaga sp.]MDO8825609.1 hypothetical protein [Methylophaga sp.]